MHYCSLLKKAFLFLLCVQALFAWALRPLKIQVVDSNNEPLTGVRIVEIDLGNETFTNFEGEGSVLLTSEKALLKIEYPGFEPKIITLSQNNSESIRVKLTKK